MAEFITKCSHCSTELQVQDEWIGMEVECPFCQKMFAINKSFSQVDNTEPAVVITPAVATGEKKCPFCGGAIKEQAVFCKHCQTNLNQTSALQEQKQLKFIFICPECDTVAELPESLKDREYECSFCCETSIAREAVDRNCPSCGEKIKIKATVCKHCRQSVTPLQAVAPLTTCPDTPKSPNVFSNFLPSGDTPGGGQSFIQKYSKSSSVVSTILFVLSTIAWIAGVFCLVKVSILLGLVFLAVGVVSAILAFALKNDGKLELQEGEVILSNCRLWDADNLNYYVRMTNQRLIFSAIEFPLLPSIIAAFAAMVAKPNRITLVWNWNEIRHITRKQERVLGVKVWRIEIDDFQEKYTFSANKKLEDFWNFRMWER